MDAETQLRALLQRLSGHPPHCRCEMREQGIDVPGMRVFLMPPARPGDMPSVTWVLAEHLTASEESGRLT